MNMLISKFVLTSVLILTLFTPLAAVQESAEIEQLKDDVERLQNRIDELEQNQRKEADGDAEEARQVEEEEEPADKADDDGKQKPEVKFGGAIGINYADQNWLGKGQGKRGLRFDNLRLAVDGSYDKFLVSAQYRWYSFSRALHHVWFGYEFEEDNRIELGVTQVPFGILPYASHSWWFVIPYYVGLEDDYDAGIKWHNATLGNWTLDLAYFVNEEYADATNLDRYSVDVVRVDEQQNEERNQFNVRVAYDFKHGKRSHTELGVSGRYGDLDNRTTGKSGDYWAAAIHANAFLGPWNLMLQGARYEYNPENPAGVSNDLVLMANLGSKRLVAAKADILVANVAYDFGAVGGPIDRLNCYNNYSYMDKDVAEFKDSQINDTGCSITMGPFWIWVDLIFGKNAWYLNDSEENSGFGPGGTDDWERRLNLNFQWYF